MVQARAKLPGLGRGAGEHWGPPVGRRAYAGHMIQHLRALTACCRANGRAPLPRSRRRAVTRSREWRECSATGPRAATGYLDGRRAGRGCGADLSSMVAIGHRSWNAEGGSSARWEWSYLARGCRDSCRSSLSRMEPERDLAIRICPAPRRIVAAKAAARRGNLLGGPGGSPDEAPISPRSYSLLERRAIMLRSLVVLTCALLTATLATLVAADQTFKATLTGDQEVPPVLTDM